MFVTRKVMLKYYFDQNNGDDGGGGGGGGGGGDDAAAKAAAEAEAARLAAEAAAAGKKGPSDEEARLLKEVMDKKGKLKEAQDKIAALEAAVKQFDGLDVESIRKMLKEKQDDETRKLEEKGQWESLKKQMIEEHGKEKGTLIAQLAERDTELGAMKSMIGDLTVGNAFANSQFIKEDMTMPLGKARVLYGAHFEFKDGAVVAYDKPTGAAERSVMVDAQGEPLSFDAAIRKIVESDPDRDQLLKSKIKSGAGSKTTQKSATPDPKLEQPTGVDRISAALSKGALGKKK